MAADVIGPDGMTVFVPNGDSRKDTATVLVGTASEYEIDQRSIRATSGGFYISDELAAIVYADEDTEPEDTEPEDTEPEDTEPEGTEDEGTEPEPETKKKTSGNRAAKKNTSKKE